MCRVETILICQKFIKFTKKGKPNYPIILKTSCDISASNLISVQIHRVLKIIRRPDDLMIKRTFKSHRKLRTIEFLPTCTFCYG